MELQGTNVSAGIVPYTDQDKYWTHWAKFGKGGLRTVPNESARLAIPIELREEYMEVTQADTGVKYRLLPGGVSKEVMTNDDWDSSGLGDMQKSEFAPSGVPGSVDFALEIAQETQDRIIYVDGVNGKDDDPAFDGTSWEKAFKTGPKALRTIKRNCPVQISILLSKGVHDFSGLTEPMQFNFAGSGCI